MAALPVLFERFVTRSVTSKRHPQDPRSAKLAIASLKIERRVLALLTTDQLRQVRDFKPATIDSSGRPRDAVQPAGSFREFHT